MEKRLVKGEKKIFGVCSGLANYFDMDPTIVRVIFLVALICFRIRRFALFNSCHCNAG